MTKKPVAENLTNNLDNTIQRVKKDMLWVLVCVVVAAAAGLAVGQLIKF